MREDGGVRTTVTLTKEQDQVLRALAEQHKVSVAWLVRHAVDRLIENGETVQLPFDLRRAS